MPSSTITIEMPDNFNDFHFPPGVQRRLQNLLDKQNQGQSLTTAEQEESEGLTEIVVWLSLLKLRAQRSDSKTETMPEETVYRNGVPLLPTQNARQPVTMELIQRLMDEE